MATLAIFTIVQNEPLWLPRWLEYYGRLADWDAVYVLDHGSRGEGAEVLLFAARDVWPVSHPYSYDDAWLVRIVQAFQQFLLASYDIVVFAAADEFLFVPGGGDFRKLLERRQQPFWPAAGYEVRQQWGEPALDWSATRLLSQRGWYTASQAYSKTLVAGCPIHWRPGFLGRPYNVLPDGQPELGLLHLHRIDQTSCLQRHREIAERAWHPEQRLTSVYNYNLLTDPERLERWLLADSDRPTEYAKLVVLPADLQQLV